MLLIKGDSEGCYTLEQYQNLKERGVLVEWGAGKDGEGNKRRDDKWGGLGTMQTKFISFPAKAEAQLTLGARRSKTSSSLCWARPSLCQRLWLWAQQ